MVAACALAIFRGKDIFNFGFQESLRTFLKPFFTGGVVEENGSCHAGFLRKQPRGGKVLLVCALIRPLPLVAATFPRPGEGFSGGGTVSGSSVKRPVLPKALPLGELSP